LSRRRPRRSSSDTAGPLSSAGAQPAAPIAMASSEAIAHRRIASVFIAAGRPVVVMTPAKQSSEPLASDQRATVGGVESS